MGNRWSNSMYSCWHDYCHHKIYRLWIPLRNTKTVFQFQFCNIFLLFFLTYNKLVSTAIIWGKKKADFAIYECNSSSLLSFLHVLNTHFRKSHSDLPDPTHIFPQNQPLLTPLVKGIISIRITFKCTLRVYQKISSKTTIIFQNC